MSSPKRLGSSGSYIGEASNGGGGGGGSPGDSPRPAPSSPVPAVDLPAYRFVLLGDANAGKSAYARRLSRGDFDSQKEVSGPVRVRVRRTLPNGNNASAEVWDCSAKELVPAFKVGEADNLWRTYLGKPQGLVVVYSDKDISEIDNVENRWLLPLRSRLETRDVIILLVLNIKHNLSANHHATMLNSLGQRHRCITARVNVATNEGVNDSMLDLMCYVHYRQRIEAVQPLPLPLQPSPPSAPVTSRTPLRGRQEEEDDDDEDEPQSSSGGCCLLRWC